MASVYILFEDLLINIKQYLILIIHFYINISNTIVTKIRVHLANIKRLSSGCLLVKPAYSTISYRNIKF